MDMLFNQKTISEQYSSLCLMIHNIEENFKEIKEISHEEFLSLNLSQKRDIQAKLFFIILQVDNTADLIFNSKLNIETKQELLKILAEKIKLKQENKTK